MYCEEVWVDGAVLESAYEGLNGVGDEMLLTICNAVGRTLILGDKQ